MRGDVGHWLDYDRNISLGLELSLQRTKALSFQWDGGPCGSKEIIEDVADPSACFVANH